MDLKIDFMIRGLVIIFLDTCVIHLLIKRERHKPIGHYYRVVMSIGKYQRTSRRADTYAQLVKVNPSRNPNPLGLQ